MSLADKKYVGAQFEKDAEIIRVRYDFSVDGGAVKDYDVLEASGKCIVRFEYAHVSTAVTSADALVADLGKGDGGTEFWSDKGKAALSLEALVLADTANTCVELEAGEKVVLGIEAFAATAGVIDFVFSVYKKR